MPGPGEPPSQQPARIIGREAGLARLRGLVDPVPQASQVLLAIGEAGMGKTVLLADAAERARSAGMRVLAVTGRESESRLAFAGLHQLLRPVLSSAAGLPARQARALLSALGLAPDPVSPDPLLTGVAVLTLLADLSERSPVLVVADDAQWLDRSSLDALAFAGSRPDAGPVLLLVGARRPGPAQAALLLAAVADGPDLSAAAGRGSGSDARALAPAEELGLVKVNRTGLQFSHPLVRSAIYHSAPFAQRAAAHRELASALYDQPDRRSWHLAAAALQPGEQVASLLEGTATHARHPG